ncbi:MAG: acylphosphatase [Planctomycetota bacterium]
MIRKVIFYSGRVQGVGFRYTTANLAKQYSVAGYVQNLDNGKVRLDVQGTPQMVVRLLEAVDRAMAGNITGKDITERPFNPALGDPNEPNAFRVRC